MSAIMHGRYLGDVQVELRHELSGVTLVTDAPPDNTGQGRSFSSTDLAAGSLGTCMLTIMAILAERSGWDLSGSHFRVEKHMSAAPRRIAKVVVDFHLPAALTTEQRKVLERGAATCPVHHSLHPDIESQISFHYDV